MKLLIHFLVLLVLLSVAYADTRWLSQENKLNYGKYTIEIYDVNTEATKCGVMVNGELKWIDRHRSEYFGSLYVNVLDVIAVNDKSNNRDSCELLLALFDNSNPCNEQEKTGTETPQAGNKTMETSQDTIEVKINDTDNNNDNSLTENMGTDSRDDKQETVIIEPDENQTNKSILQKLADFIKTLFS